MQRRARQTVDESEVKRLEGALADLNEREKRLVHLYTLGEFSEENLRQESAEIAGRRKVMSDQLASLNREALPDLDDLDQERLEAICAVVAGRLDVAGESERTVALEALQLVVRATTDEATIARVLPLEVPRFVMDGESMPADDVYLRGLPFAVSFDLAANMTPECLVQQKA